MAETKPRLVRWLTDSESAAIDSSHGPEYRRGWVDETTTVAMPMAWTLLPYPGVAASQCRRSPKDRCPNPPAAIFWRSAGRRSGAVLQPWVYCPEHMFGRIIEDGKVLGAWLLDPADFPDVPVEGTCPGCGSALRAPKDCDRCEYFNLVPFTGRYHYCGEPSCFCRNLPGLSSMFDHVRQELIAQHRARAAAVGGGQDG